MAEEKREIRIPEVHSGAGTRRGGHIGSNTPSATQLADRLAEMTSPKIDPSHELTYSPAPPAKEERKGPSGFHWGRFVGVAVATLGGLYLVRTLSRRLTSEHALSPMA